MDAIATLVTVFGIFIPALLLPGPDFVAVTRSAITRGTADGLLTTLGVTLGLGMYATLSLIGLAAVLVEYQWLTWVVRVLGGSYLIYLGIRLLWSRPSAADDPGDRHGPVRGNPLAFGFLVTLTNPKAIVLFASVFATSVTAETSQWLLMTMIVLVMASTFVWYTIVTLFMSSAPVMRRLSRARHWIERTAGACFVAIGGRILLDARSPVAQ